MANTFIDANQLWPTTATVSSATSLYINDCAPAICRRCMVCDVSIPYDKAYPLCDECRHRIHDTIYGPGNAFDEYVFDGHIWEEEQNG